MFGAPSELGAGTGSQGSGQAAPAAGQGGDRASSSSPFARCLHFSRYPGGGAGLGLKRSAVHACVSPPHALPPSRESTEHRPPRTGQGPGAVGRVGGACSQNRACGGQRPARTRKGHREPSSKHWEVPECEADLTRHAQHSHEENTGSKFRGTKQEAEESSWAGRTGSANAPFPPRKACCLGCARGPDPGSGSGGGGGGTERAHSE